MFQSLVLVPIGFFAFLAVVLLIPVWLRHRLRMAALHAISDALGQGRAADAELIEKLLVPPRSAVGKGFTLIVLALGVGALGIGIALTISAALFTGAATADAGMMVGALVNVCIGIGFIGLGSVGLWRFSGLKRPAPRWDYATVMALICLFLGVSGLSIGSGLGLSAYFYIGPQRGAAAAAELFIGALVNACSGAGFTALGSLLLRMFADRQEG